MTSSRTAGQYMVFNETSKEIQACYYRLQTPNGTVWQTVNPLVTSLPLFAMQQSLIIFTTRLFIQILKPLHQPRLVADILSGIVLGATALAKFGPFVSKLYPFEGTIILESMSNLGLTYYMFLVGLEMDLTPIWQVGMKTLMISMAGIFPPMGIGIGLYRLFMVNTPGSPVFGEVFWAIALTVTSFPDLARLLSDLKLMHTDLGRIALTTAIVNDTVSWALLVAAITVINVSNPKIMITILLALPTLIFIPFCWFVLRPAVFWLIRHSVASKGSSSSQGNYTDMHVYSIITAVPFFGLITDACGSHSMIGAFMFGLIIPHGELGMKVMERLEEFVTGILLPAFFLTTGLRTNLSNLLPHFRTAVITVILACFTKIVSTFLVSSFLGFSSMDGFALGVLMNTKGVLALIVLNAGRNLKGFDNSTFGAMMLAYLIMTMFVGPFITYAYKPAKGFKQYKHRTLERSKPDTELRVITCVHSFKNLSGMIKLLQVSNATKKSPLCVFALHLVELDERGNAAMLIVHDAVKSGASHEKPEENQIISSFQNLESENAGRVSVQPLTVVSAYASMHEDVINLAKDKCVTLILVPFHKLPSADGRMEDDNLSIRQVNENLLATSPCSVGIYIDRGLGSTMGTDSIHGKQPLRVIMLFIGGSDDREALAYAWRIAGSPGVTLTVVRFIAGKDAVEVMPEDFTAFANTENEKQIDDAYINEFRFRCMCNDSITYLDRLVNTGEQTVEVIRTSYNDFNLYIVGRGKEGASPLTSGLVEWSECPELGAIGDILMQSDFMSLASVIVVQQYTAAATSSGSKTLPGMPRPGEATPEFEAFVNHRKRDDHDD